MAGFIAVHTGAGNRVNEARYHRIIKEACLRAVAVLRAGGSAIDACEVAIQRLENHGNTNAGFGSNLCMDGFVQCEASIMNGSNLHFGACTNVSTVRNPIQLARKLCDGQDKMLSMERIPPMIMAGKGAEQYAAIIGCEIVNANKLVSKQSKHTFEVWKSELLKAETQKLEDSCTNIQNEEPMDTIGAVAVDVAGHSAAGCSSGGIMLKLTGRVGQAATYGAGCWAMDAPDLSASTCTTGNGEYLMKTLLAKQIVDDLAASARNLNVNVVEVLHNTFKQKFIESPFVPKNQDIFGGALTLLYNACDGNGQLLWSHNTNAMCVGYMSTQQKSPQFVNSRLPTLSTKGKTCSVQGCNFQLNTNMQK